MNVWPPSETFFCPGEGVVFLSAVRRVWRKDCGLLPVAHWIALLQAMNVGKIFDKNLVKDLSPISFIFAKNDSIYHFANVFV